MNPELATTDASTINTSSVNAIKKSFLLFSEEIKKKTSFLSNQFSHTGGLRNRKFKIPRTAVVIVAAIAVVGGIIFFVKSTQTQANPNGSAKPAAPTAKSTYEINKEFEFPIKDADGKTISSIKYVVESANLQDEILVKGERARAVQGRTFLIIGLKIKNTYKQGIQINSRDYVRLVVDGKKDELTAADIHNDPVEVQAISTKSTRIGFPINEEYKSLDLQVGEINGKKETILIKFPQN